MQNYEFTLKNRFGFHEFLMKENFTDTTLVCEKQLIKCHKVLLAASSQYFHDLFMLLGEINSATIVLKDISLNQLLKILEYIYCGRVTVAKNELNDFKEAAEYFEMNMDFDNTIPLPTDDETEFMSQETTADNLTLDSFRLNESEQDELNCSISSVSTLTGEKTSVEPDKKKLKLTDSFRTFSMRTKHASESFVISQHQDLSGIPSQKRNYFDFSNEQKKKVAFDILREKCISAGKVQMKPKRF